MPFVKRLLFFSFQHLHAEELQGVVVDRIKERVITVAGPLVQAGPDCDHDLIAERSYSHRGPRVPMAFLIFLLAAHAFGEQAASLF
jgi:hypothetical protein